MNAVTFDTHQAVRRLEAAGIETHQAEAIVSELHNSSTVNYDLLATKADLERFATKADLERFATKADFERFATKADLERFATKADLERFATKADLERFATKADLEQFATKAELASLEARLYRALWIQGGAIVVILTGLTLAA